MPPRHTYWTIILEGKPTAFRAASADELLPTLRQLQSRHPEAVMMWFARGRLWPSPEDARAAMARRPDRERRDRAWRPGGEHRDPRDRFKVPRDEKRRRFAAKLRRDRTDGGPPAGERGPRPGGPPRDGDARRERPAGGFDRGRPPATGGQGRGPAGPGRGP